MKVPFYKRLLSLVTPVHITDIDSEIHPVLELHYYRKSWKLATDDAWYSDGKRYRPLVHAFRAIGDDLQEIETVLILGTGLGSAVHILEHEEIHPDFTLVELDQSILDTAIKLMPAGILPRIHPVCRDAEHFVQESTDRYSLCVCDLFIGREVPGFVRSVPFLNHCKALLQPGGHFVLNFIPESDEQLRQLKITLNSIYPGYQTLDLGLNKVFLADV